MKSLCMPVIPSSPATRPFMYLSFLTSSLFTHSPDPKATMVCRLQATRAVLADRCSRSGLEAVGARPGYGTRWWRGDVRVLLFVVGLLTTVLSGDLFADGWHNAALFTGDLDNWAKQEAQGLPLTRDEGSASTKTKLKVGAGRPPGKAGAAEPDATSVAEQRLGGNLNAQQRNQLMMKAQNFVEVLAYMRSDNILMPEFPNFNHALIPKYREKAYELLQRSGSAGTHAALEQLRNLLMGGGPSGDVQGFHPDFVRQMLSMFEGGLKANHFSASELLELLALTDTRQVQIAKLATAVREAINTHLELVAKLELAEQAKGEKRVHDLVLNMVRSSLQSAAASELIAALKSPSIPASVRQQVGLRLEKQLSQLDWVGLLLVVQSVEEPGIRNAARQVLRTKSPQIADLTQHAAELASLVGDPDAVVSGEAKRVLQLAVTNFRSADAPAVLDFLASAVGNPTLGGAAVPELARKLANMAASDRDAYRSACQAVLSNRQAAAAQVEAALWLLSRLSSKEQIDKPSVRVLVDALPQLQKTAFASAGRALQAMTGQNFGPTAAMSIGQVVAVQNRWQQWLQTQP
jgi:hypothetical protein